MNKLTVIEHSNERVMLTQQLAEHYATESIKIQQNYSNNKKRYTHGVHFFLLEGEELRAFKREVENFEVAENINKLYLWTERGAFLHAKSLGTDEAWKTYGTLIETYFRAKEMFSSNSLDPLKTKRLEIMERNSRTRQGQVLIKIAESSALSPEAKALVLIDAHEIISGKMLPFRPQTSEPLMTAGEIGRRAGAEIGARMGLEGLCFTEIWIGTLSERFGLKADEYGKTVLDKKKHSEGQIPAFRYNDKALNRFCEILSDTANWPKSLIKKMGIAL